MCFQPRRFSTNQLRQRPGRTRNTIVRNDERLRIGYKRVLKGVRTNISKAGAIFTTEYPVGRWVHGQEINPNRFVSFRSDQPERGQCMKAGIYLYRTRPQPAAAGASDRYQTVQCAYRPEDVLGANGAMVCVRAVLVLD